MIYIFTDKTLKKVLDIKLFSPEEFSNWGGEALKHRQELSKKLKIPVLAWASMGGDNPIKDITL